MIIITFPKQRLNYTDAIMLRYETCLNFTSKRSIIWNKYKSRAIHFRLSNEIFIGIFTISQFFISAWNDQQWSDNNHSIVDVQYLSINRDTKHPRNHSNSPSLPDSNHLSHFLPTKIPHVPINQAGHSSNPELRFLPFQLSVHNSPQKWAPRISAKCIE